MRPIKARSRKPMTVVVSPGTGGAGATNDVAVVWPPGRGPLVVTAYYAESTAPGEERERVLAEVGRLAANA
jgi:beta-lactamase class A